MKSAVRLLATVLFALTPSLLLANPESTVPPSMTGSWVGFFALGLFVVAYALVMAEEFTLLRKSKPVILAAGIIWALIAIEYHKYGMSKEVEEARATNATEAYII